MRKNNVIIDTIIIGAGVSGLGCARTLFENNKQFKIITTNIGGRILESKNGDVNYGAYYVAKDYSHIKKYVQLGKRLSIFRIGFNKRNGSYSLLNKRLLRYCSQLLNIVSVLIEFRKHYNKFKKKCERMPQVDVLKNDEFLWGLYNENAAKFIKRIRIKEICEYYFSQVLRGTTFLQVNKLNAFEFLQFCSPLIVPIYEFHFLKDKKTNDIEKNIIFDSVKQICKHKNYYEIKTKREKRYYAKNLVVAASPEMSFKLLKLPAAAGVSVHMFHINGEMKEPWKYYKINLFDNSSDIFAIARQENGTYLVYSKNKNIKLFNLFKKYSIIARKFWNPAFILRHKNLVDSRIDKNLYLIGDYNICGLEDSYITGVFAANDIIKKC